MFELLLSLIFGIHLLAVDCAMAGPLLSVWLRWRARREPTSAWRHEPRTDQIGRRMAGWSLAAAALGVGLGLAALLLVQHAEAAPYRRAISRLPNARWWFVTAEVAFYFVTLGAYFLLWRKLERWPILHALLAVVAATDLIYHFPPLFAVVSTLSLRPKLWDVPLDRTLYWQLLLDGETLSRVVHHWLAAWAVGATGVMLLSLRSSAAGNVGNSVAEIDEPPAKSIAGSKTTNIRRRAARMALVVTLVQLPVGVWGLQAVSPLVQSQLLGEDAWSTALFGASLLAGLGLLHHLAMAALGDSRRGATLRAAGLMVATVLLMVAAFHRARQQAFLQIAVPAAASNLR